MTNLKLYLNFKKFIWNFLGFPGLDGSKGQKGDPGLRGDRGDTPNCPQLDIPNEIRGLPGNY